MPRTDAAETDAAKKIIRGACPHDCPDTCAMLVTVQDGRATEVRGDPEHPFTRGALCVKVNDYVERVYSPDRVLHPLRRVGLKGSGKFERIGWDAALDEIASRYKAIIAEHGAQAILPYSYPGTEGPLSVTIHPEDAAKRGIAEARVVRVFNDRGSFKALAHVSDAVRPGVVVAPLGYWRKFSRSNSTVNAANSSMLADLGNAPTFSDNLVEVEAAGRD